MKTIMFLLLVASSATCLAGDVITVNVHGPATESLWRNAGHPWQSTIGGTFKPNVGELVPAWTFDLRPGGADWYSSHTLTDAEDVAPSWTSTLAMLADRRNRSIMAVDRSRCRSIRSPSRRPSCWQY